MEEEDGTWEDAPKGEKKKRTHRKVGDSTGSGA